MRSMGWFMVLLLLAAADLAHAGPVGSDPPMPDPCVEAPNLPFCQ